LHVNVKDLLVYIQKKKIISMFIVKQLLDKIVCYLELLKNQFTQTNVINVIDKLIVKINRNYKKIKKDITIIRKIITNFSLFVFLFFFIYFKNSF